jgi:hypothetical protein
MGPERKFRVNTVQPFLKTLKNTHAFPVQQVAITGTPDYLLCIRGVFVGLELKADTGVLAPLQKWNLDQIERCHGVAIVASPKNWVSVRAQLKRLDEGVEND